VITIAWGASSHAGRVRETNEDAVCVEAPIFAVADGMGGHHAGDLASALAVGALASFDRGWALTRPVLRTAFASANEAIFERADRDGLLMGTTLSGLAFLVGWPPMLMVFNVGDSRTYVRRAGERHELQQLTRDHSYVQELYEAGDIGFEEIASHPERHVVTRALGVDPDVVVDEVMCAVEAGQRWLICSDGLTSEVTPAEILAGLEADDPQQAAERLVEATLSRGARDNVSVVVIDVIGVEVVDDPERTDPRPSPLVGDSRSASGGRSRSTKGGA
jgi:protein phosphatase